MSQVDRILLRLAVRDIQAIADRWEDEANDALIGVPGRPANSARAAYIDAMRGQLLAGLLERRPA